MSLGGSGTADDFSTVPIVRARRRIEDNPLSCPAVAAQRGQLGSVEDVADDLVWVDFGGACVLPCSPDEIAPA